MKENKHKKRKIRITPIKLRRKISEKEAEQEIKEGWAGAARLNA